MTITAAQVQSAAQPFRSAESDGGEAITAREARDLVLSLQNQFQASASDMLSAVGSLRLTPSVETAFRGRVAQHALREVLAAEGVDLINPSISPAQASAAMSALRALDFGPADSVSAVQSNGNLRGNPARLLLQTFIHVDMSQQLEHEVQSPPSADELRAYGQSMRGAPVRDLNAAFESYASTYHQHIADTALSQRALGGPNAWDIQYPTHSNADAAISGMGPGAQANATRIMRRSPMNANAAYRPSDRQFVGDDGRRLQDCDGYALLAHDFFAAAGFDTEFVVCNADGGAHRMLWAHRGRGARAEAVMVSNASTWPFSGRAAPPHPSLGIVDTSLRRMHVPPAERTEGRRSADFENSLDSGVALR